MSCWVKVLCEVCGAGSRSLVIVLDASSGLRTRWAISGIPGMVWYSGVSETPWRGAGDQKIHLGSPNWD